MRANFGKASKPPAVTAIAAVHHEEDGPLPEFKDPPSTVGVSKKNCLVSFLPCFPQGLVSHLQLAGPHLVSAEYPQFISRPSGTYLGYLSTGEDMGRHSPNISGDLSTRDTVHFVPGQVSNWGDPQDADFFLASLQTTPEKGTLRNTQTQTL